MKVLHFFKTYWPDTFGGIERSIHAIAKGTQRYGIETDVLSLSRQPALNTRNFDGHMAWKAKLDIELASTGFSHEVFGRFRALSEKADIVHYHFPWPMMDIVHMVTRCSKPTVLTYHSDIVKQRTLMRFYRPVMRQFLGRMDRVVATSPNYLRSSEVLRALASPPLFIPLGLDEADYPKPGHEKLQHWRSRLPMRFFLFVGVLRYYKGAHILVEAAKRSGLNVVIVGDGPMSAGLKAEATRNSLQNVIFTGALPDEDKIALINLCEALILPSHLRSEAFGLSLVEATMFGKPMISCEIGTGTSYVNLEGITGYTIRPESPDDLADAMRKLTADAAARTRFGQNARRRYEENFTAERMASDYATLYRNLISEKSTFTP